MQKHLLGTLSGIIMLSSCVSTANRKTGNSSKWNSRNQPAITSNIATVNNSMIMQPDLPKGILPVALTELPRTEDGAFVLSPGLYEAEFKTYCLQPGTPGPSSKDVYFQTALEGSRKDIIQTILVNSRSNSYLEQKNVQLLLWSVVSRSDFQKLSFDVQYTARQLLSPKQIYELQGGVMGTVKTLARAFPVSGKQNDIMNLFETGVRSYEAFERLAVVNEPSTIHRNDLTQDLWYRQEDGYYVRYLPNNYKQTRIQVYVPAGVADSAAIESGNYMVFDPTSWVVVPANSNAQRLGIGGPMIDIIKSVIRNTGSGKGSLPKKSDSSKTPPAPAKGTQ